MNLTTKEALRRELEKLRDQQRVTTTPTKISPQDFGRVPQLVQRNEGDF